MTRLAMAAWLLAACSAGSSPAPAPDPWQGMWTGQAQSARLSVIVPVAMSLRAVGSGEYSGMLSVDLGGLVLDFSLEGEALRPLRLQVEGEGELGLEMVLDLGPPGAMQGLYVLSSGGVELDFGVLDLGRQG